MGDVCFLPCADQPHPLSSGHAHAHLFRGLHFIGHHPNPNILASFFANQLFAWLQNFFQSQTSGSPQNVKGSENTA
jgi:hypothetical protein